jgi:hypothetical protein
MSDDGINESDRLLRQFERELDCFHKSLPIMKRSPESALYGVMAAYDSMLITLVAVSQQMDKHAIGSLQAMRTIVQSINPALFWLTSEGTYPTPLPAQDVQLIDDGGNFLTHARDYFQLSAFHAIYSRGSMSVECNKEERLVKFIRPKGHQFPDGYASAITAERANRRKDHTRDQIISALNRWLANVTYRLKDGRIYFDLPTEFASGELIAPPSCLHRAKRWKCLMMPISLDLQ